MTDYTHLDIADPKLRELLNKFSTDARFRMENLLKVRDIDGRANVPLRFNEAQVALYERRVKFQQRREPVRIIICKSRRAGLSTGVAAILFDEMTTKPKTDALIVAHEKNPSGNVLGMYTRFWENMPEAMQIEKYRIKIRPDLPASYRNNPPSDKLLLEEPLGSNLFIASARNIEGYRSYGFNAIHATEGAYYEDGYGLFRALGPALVKGPESMLFVESTPNGQQGKGAWFFEMCMRAASNKQTDYGQMSLVFVPWHHMPISFSLPFGSPEKRASFERSLSAEEKDLWRQFPQVTLEQLQWVRMTVQGETCGGDWDVFSQEFPSDLATCFLMSGTSVYGRKTIKRLMTQHVRPPIWEGDIFWGASDEANRETPIHAAVREPIYLKPWEAKQQGRAPHTNERTYKNLAVWRWPNAGERVIITGDVGGGGKETRDGDYSVLMVFVLNELQKDELIMRWHGRLNEVAFAEVASALAHAVYRQVGPTARSPELAIEWTGPGKATCTYIDHMRLYDNQYRYQPMGVHGLPSSKHVGWESNSKTKSAMIGYSVRMVEADMIDVPDEVLVTEMSSYRQTDRFGDEGSYSGVGMHDDHVSCFQIGCVLLRWRSAIDPREEPATEVDDALDETELPAWEWRASETPRLSMPGQDYETSDESDWNESLWYADA